MNATNTSSDASFIDHTEWTIVEVEAGLDSAKSGWIPDWFSTVPESRCERVTRHGGVFVGQCFLKNSKPVEWNQPSNVEHDDWQGLPILVGDSGFA